MRTHPPLPQVTRSAWRCLGTLCGCQTGRATSCWGCRRAEEAPPPSTSVPEWCSRQALSSCTTSPSQVGELHNTPTLALSALHNTPTSPLYIINMHNIPLLAVHNISLLSQRNTPTWHQYNVHIVHNIPLLALHPNITHYLTKNYTVHVLFQNNTPSLPQYLSNIQFIIYHCTYPPPQYLSKNIPLFYHLNTSPLLPALCNIKKLPLVYQHHSKITCYLIAVVCHQYYSQL